MLACISGAKSINIHDGLRKACKLFIKLFSTVRATGISATFEYQKWPKRMRFECTQMIF